MKIFVIIIGVLIGVFMIVGSYFNIKDNILRIRELRKDLEDNKASDGLREAQLLDTILAVLSVHRTANIDLINLELRKCGYPLTIPETMEKVKKIESDGYLVMNNDNVRLN